MLVFMVELVKHFFNIGEMSDTSQQYTSNYSRINSSKTQKSILEKLNQYHATDHEFFQNKVCLVCMQEFKNEDDVTPLPCDLGHYFHPNCIEEWVACRGNCPLCHIEISQQSMLDFSIQIEINLPDNGSS